MRTPNDLWEALGALHEDDAYHTLSRLFALYEDLLAREPDNQEALLFFQKLDIALSQTEECNLNRR